MKFGSRDRLWRTTPNMRSFCSLLVVAVLSATAGAQVTHFGLAPSTGQIQAGVPFSLQIQALNNNIQVVTSYGGTITLEIGGVFTPPPQFTFTTADQGILNVPVTLRSSGMVTMVVTDTVTSAGGNITVNVQPTHFSVSAPASVIAGVP